jgi:hypothetical protein
VALAIGDGQAMGIEALGLSHGEDGR